MADYEEGFRTAVGCSLEPMGAGSLWLRTRGPLCGSLLQGMVLMEPLYVYSDRACFEITENRNPRQKPGDDEKRGRRAKRRKLSSQPL